MQQRDQLLAEGAAGEGKPFNQQHIGPGRVERRQQGLAPARPIGVVNRVSRHVDKAAEQGVGGPHIGQAGDGVAHCGRVGGPVARRHRHRHAPGQAGRGDRVGALLVADAQKMLNMDEKMRGHAWVSNSGTSGMFTLSSRMRARESTAKR